MANEVLKTDEIIKKIMDYYGLNQIEFAAKYKFDTSQVSRWINGKAIPRGDVVLLLHQEYEKIKDKLPPLLAQLI